MKRSVISLFALLLALASCQRGSYPSPGPSRCFTGVANAGEKVLPTTKAITPAGSQVRVGGHPQGMALSPAGDLLLVSENGVFLPHGIRSLDPMTGKVLGFNEFINLFVGVAFAPDGKSAYASGGGDNRLYRFSVTGQQISSTGFLSLQGFSAGLTVSPSGTVFVAILDQNSVIAVDPQSWTLARTFTTGDGIGSYPWTVGVSPDGGTLVVLNRGSGTATFISLGGTFSTTTIPLGDPAPEIHPASMVFDAGRKRCYIANVNADSISVIDLETQDVLRIFSLSPYPGAPYGSNPDSLALSPDGKTLYVALSGENAVAVVDTDSGLVTGKIPTAWYPSALALSPDGKRLYIANMKGEGQGPHFDADLSTEGTVWAVKGTVSLVEVPDGDTLTEGLEQVRRNNCVQLARKEDQFHDAFKNIRHVVYLFRENKTFDTVFGDVSPEGRPLPQGYPLLYGYGPITPNIHALADKYSLYTNFYSDIEVSNQGHPFAVGVNLPDWIERLWPLDYGNRPMPNISSYNNRVEAYPISRFIFDRIVQAGLTFSNFGMFLSVDRPELQPFNVNVTDPSTGQRMTDVAKAGKFLEALAYYESRREMPPFIFITLPDNHCPPCLLAMNDLATGMIVDGLSHSSFWKDSVVFITEDDPQPGWDHIDAQRMYAVVAGPYVKKGYRSPRHYSFPNILKTIEMIMGFPPLSQNDANALAMTDCFTTKADLTPFDSMNVSMVKWAQTSLQIKEMEKAWCKVRAKLFSGPHPLCTWHKFDTLRQDDD